MTQDGIEDVVDRLKAALQAEPASARLQTALAAGLRPNDRYIDQLVERFTIEPDFFVRDMLTWALIQHDPTLTLERVLPELSSVFPQARAQALHTLSKIGDQRAWPAITTELLADAEDEVARTAWRAAATLVPDGEESALAETLSTQFARGDRTTQRSLSRALAALGDVATPVIKKAKRRRNPAVRTHAIATEKLIKNPDAGFDVAIEAAQRIVALRGAPLVDHVAE
ncbi:MAG: HEAT repeat domain-containing protein [Propionicimonas sp.]|uniref:HEAT repeat domain-containing protein n=1 Tax=Propionicimonas sp. TaxID=1955623 RepID=UPI001E02B7CE|nr:HEAT repeat domain-containing protein [Propionicimonas sp.]MBU4189298.1 HEAT repeat domain-containing protein [Actinomycetota bacterium]MBU4205241.1 HEAT repeat domain-containing protein [Actinomycetota bacterium]MBU4251150.1 HEAT repeat domain-containing protein [Actinomycetota bacterium]MBU4363124.1 HEAT repeat domain-containing protein [Actinomycetota bacterium]MBU4416277.1 HEAT repeat domain-containing protein [Actinomycetota bacterium]